MMKFKSVKTYLLYAKWKMQNYNQASLRNLNNKCCKLFSSQFWYKLEDEGP